MIYAAPGAEGAKITYKPQYDNFIGGKFVPPVKGQYFDVITPVSGKVYTRAARSTAEDIELALDAAHAASDAWGRTSAAERPSICDRNWSASRAASGVPVGSSSSRSAKSSIGKVTLAPRRRNASTTL